MISELHSMLIFSSCTLCISVRLRMSYRMSRICPRSLSVGTSGWFRRSSKRRAYNKPLSCASSSPEKNAAGPLRFGSPGGWRLVHQAAATETPFRDGHGRPVQHPEPGFGSSQRRCHFPGHARGDSRGDVEHQFCHVCLLGRRYRVPVCRGPGRSGASGRASEGTPRRLWRSPHARALLSHHGGSRC